MGAAESAPKILEKQEIKIPNSPFERIQRISRRKNGKLLQGLLFESSVAYGNECKNAIQYLKKFRHPDILKVLAQKDLPEGGILTEDAEPLSSHKITDLGLSQIQSGLSSIGNALLFLHESAGISHNNLCQSTIFIRTNGSFALGGFEFAEEIGKDPKPRQRLQTDAFLGVQKEKDGTLRDAYLFGQLINEISKDYELPENLLELSNNLCKTDPDDRFSIKEALEHPAMKNDLATILDKLINFSVLPDDEKSEFIGSLPDRLDLLDPISAGSLLSKPILSRPIMFFEDSHKQLYPRFFTPKTSKDNGILPSETFVRFTLPEILYIWRVRDVAVRIPLLKYLPLYIVVLSRGQLEKTIIPEIHAGVEDLNPELVASSYEGLAHCVRALGPSLVTGINHKKIFRDSSPIQRMEQRNGHFESFEKPKSMSIKDSSSQENSNFHSPQAPSSSAVFSGSEGDHNDEWNEEWGDDDHQDEPSPSNEEPESPITPQAPILDSNRNKNQVVKPAMTEVLDVKEIKVKPSNEEDFFADMAPEIKTEGTLIDKLLKEQEERLKNGVPESAITMGKKKSSILFSLREETSTENETSAWEDELTLDPSNEIQNLN